MSPAERAWGPLVSGRHQNTTRSAIDPALLARLRSLRDDCDALARRLASLPRDPELNAAHYEDVWRRAPTSPTDAARFGIAAQPWPGASELVEAFGGTPDPNERDLRRALRDALLDVDTVRRIASALTLPPVLDELHGTVPHPVEHFDVDPTHASVIAEVASFFRRAADASRCIDVRWHANP